MHEFNMMYGSGFFSPPVFGAGIGILVLWSLFWKALALWRAAKRGEKVWFVVFMLINTMGILEIVYLFFITGAKLSDFSLSKSDHSHE